MPKIARLVDDWSGIPDLHDLRRYVVYEPLRGAGPAAALAWLEGDVPDGWLDLDERPQWDRGGSFVHRIVFFRRLPSVTRDEFARHWTEQHAPLAARHHPTLRRYVQNVVRSAGDVDGVAELGFADVDDMERRVYDSDEGKRVIREDVATFIDVRAGSRVDGRARVLYPPEDRGAR
jgi:uncharacterized protein (TIGR02118 family)